MDKRKNKMGTRRSSRRGRLTSGKYYGDRDSSSESEQSIVNIASCSSSSIHFKWSKQSQMVTEQLRKLYLEHGSGRLVKDQGSFLTTDVTLVSCEGDSIQAHKMILILCCPYFWKLFSKNFSSNNVVVMGNVSTSCLRNLIRFVYTGVVDVASGDENEFLKTATFLGIVGVQKGGTGNNKPSQHATVSVASQTTSQQTSTSMCLESKEDERYGNGKSVSNKMSVKTPTSTEDTSCKVESTTATFSRSGQDGDDDSCNVPEDDDFGADNDFDGEQSDASFPDYPDSYRYKGMTEEGRPTYGRNKDLWIEMKSLTEEEIAEDWRKRHYFKGLQDYEYWLYYCYYGGSRKCGARIKCIKEEGVTTFYTNQVPHSNHRQVAHGLPPETKRFIVSMMEQGIRRCDKIISAMELLSMDIPTKKQISCFVNYTIRTSGQVFPFPKQPKINPPGSRAAKARVVSKKLGRPRTGRHPQINVRGLPGVPVGSTKKKNVDEQDDKDDSTSTTFHQPSSVYSDNSAITKTEDFDNPQEVKAFPTHPVASRHFSRCPPISTSSCPGLEMTQALQGYGVSNLSPHIIPPSSYPHSSGHASQSYPYY